jgi:hypothetical protein
MIFKKDQFANFFLFSRYSRINWARPSPTRRAEPSLLSPWESWINWPRPSPTRRAEPSWFSSHFASVDENVYFWDGSQGEFRKRFWKIWIAFVRNEGWSVDNVFLVLGRVLVETSGDRLRRTFLQVWLQVDSWHVVRRVVGANGKVGVGIIPSALHEMVLHSIESDLVALVVRTRDKHLFLNTSIKQIIRVENVTETSDKRKQKQPTCTMPAWLHALKKTCRSRKRER